MNFLFVLFLSFIEGVTEFLPISSTGHLILASHFFNLQNDHFVTQFNIIIQFGAIISVLVLYWKKFIPSQKNDLNRYWKFYLKLFVAMLPAAILGILVKNQIDSLLESTLVVCLALIAGGVILFFLDEKSNKPKSMKTINDLTFKESFYIGLFQCIAFIPGFSRAAATIMGGLIMKLSQKEATEFSFFLAVPTIAGAAFIKLLKVIPQIQPQQASDLLLGTVLSFFFALLSIKFFITLLSRGKVFRWFGIYRIILGLLVLLLMYS